MIVGSGKIDLYLRKGGNEGKVSELKTVSKILKENGKKTKEDTKIYHQLKKYLDALNVKTGILINFPFRLEKNLKLFNSNMENLKFKFNYYLMELEMWWSNIWLSKTEKQKIKDSLKRRREQGGCSSWQQFFSR